MRVSQAEQTAEQAFQETGGMLDQVHDLKDKVVQVGGWPHGISRLIKKAATSHRL